jgi:predicted dehydrogenase
VALQAAIVGAGDWASTGLGPALRSLPGVDLVACAAASQDEAESFAKRMETPRAYGSLDRLLSEESNLDLLVIATPDDHHARATAAALEAGLAVYCEKPLANTAEEAEQLADLAEQTGSHATVGYSFRYSPALQQMRDDLRSGRLGAPWLIELYEHNPQFHPKLGKPMNWKGDPAHAGAGALFEYGSHALDLGCWLLGPVTDVATNFARVLPGARLDDIATVQLTYASGAIGTLVAGWVLTGSFPGIRVRLHCSEGLAEAQLDEWIPGGERYTRFALNGEVLDQASLPPLTAGRASYASRHLADLVAGVTRGAHSTTLPTLRAATHVQHVLDAAVTAAGTRTEVTSCPSAQTTHGGTS